MKTFVAIPVVNRPDLLERAIACVPKDIPILVQDNSGGKMRINYGGNVHPLFDCKGLPPLSYSQSMNAFQARAKNEGCDFWLNMHSDGFAKEEDFDNLIKMANEVTDDIAAVYTHYDVLAAFMTGPVHLVGGWDQVLANYFTDNDFSRWAGILGFRFQQLEPHTVQHGVDGAGSQTINSDQVLLKTNGVMFPAYRAYYVAKWGGVPGQEGFPTPWNL